MNISYHDVSARKVLCIRSFSGFSAALALYAALQIIPFSQVQIIGQMSPVFMVFIGPCFLKEKSSYIDILGLILSLAGIVIYSNPGGLISSTDRSQDFKHGEDANSWIGLLLGLYASFAGSIVITALRLMKGNLHPTVQAFYYGIVGSVFSPVVMMGIDSSRGSFDTMTLTSLALLILCGLTFTIGTQFLAYSFHFQKAARIAMFSYLQTVYGFFFDVVLFQSVLRWNDYLSGFLIFLGTFLVSLMKALGQIK